MKSMFMELDEATVNYVVATHSLVVSVSPVKLNERCVVHLPPDQKHLWDVVFQDNQSGLTTWRVHTVNGVPCGRDGKPLFASYEEARRLLGYPITPDTKETDNAIDV